MKNKFLFFLLAADIFLLVVLSWLVYSTPHFSIDLKITNFLQGFSSIWIRDLMILVSIPGYDIYKGISVISISLFLAYFKKIRWVGFSLLSFAGAEILEILLKHLILRQRPDYNLISYIFRLEKTPSFPSGHVLFYVCYFGFLWYLSRKINNKVLRNILSLIFGFLILAIGFSRIYLGAHWFTDVLGGYLAGIAWLLISILLYNAWTQDGKGKSKTNI